MIVCAHVVGLPLDWGLQHVLPRLLEIQKACTATNAAIDVQTILRRGLQ
jgi:hypothetical protein